MRKQWQVMVILLVAVVLVSNMAILGPLYQNYSSEVLLRHQIKAVSGTDQLTIETPGILGVFVIGRQIHSADDVIQKYLGEMYDSEAHYRLSVFNPTGGLAAHIPQERITYPWETHSYKSSTAQILAFDDYINDYLRVVDGRLPIHNDMLPETAISSAVADETGLKVGDVYLVDGYDLQLQLLVVGIIEPVARRDAIWEGNRLLTEGAWTYPPYSPAQYHWGMMVPMRTYEALVEQKIDNHTIFGRVISLDTDVVTADNARRYQSNMEILNSLVREQVDGGVVRFSSPLMTALNAHQRQFDENQGIIIFLAVLLLILMLYNLLTTGQLAMQMQEAEWGIFQSRGMGYFQALRLHAVPFVILALIAAIASLLTSRLLLLFIATLITRDKRGLENVALPELSLQLLVGASIASVFILLIPAVQMTRLNIVLQRQQATRPGRPVWAVLFLDVTFFVVGLALLARLYMYAGGTFADLRMPLEFIQESTREIETSQLLKDPLNILGGILILISISLLWMRIFPLLMKGVSSITAERVQTLGIPFAVWNVERGTARYGQFVIIVLSTLSIGVASLTLSHTQEVGAWRVAQDENGSDIRIVLEQPDENQPWLTVSDVEDYSEIVRFQARPRQTGYTKPIPIIAIDPATVAAVRPDLEPVVARLNPEQKPFRSGIALPPRIDKIQVSVYSLEHPNRPNVIFALDILDSNNQLFTILLREDDKDYITTPDKWVIFSQTVSRTANRPFRLMSVTVQTDNSELFFEHSIRVRDWVAVTETGEEVPLLVTDNWQFVDDNVTIRSTLGPTTVERANAEIRDITLQDNTRATSLDYTIRRQFGTRHYPRIAVNPQPKVAVPVLISEGFARAFRDVGETTGHARTDNLQVGDTREMLVEINGQAIALRFEVTGVVEDFATLQDEPIFMVIQQTEWTNLAPGLSAVNEVWLDLENDQPSNILRASLPDENVFFTWDHYQTLLRDPIPNTVAGLFFGGFWLSLSLSLMNFAFYTYTIARQRSVSFGILRALGWNIRNLWRVLVVEQSFILLPSVVIGTAMGLGIAFLLLPFMGLQGTANLQVPVPRVVLIILILVLSFISLQSVLSRHLKRMSIQQALRTGEE